MAFSMACQSVGGSGPKHNWGSTTSQTQTPPSEGPYAFSKICIWEAVLRSHKGQGPSGPTTLPHSRLDAAELLYEEGTTLVLCALLSNGPVESNTCKEVLHEASAALPLT